MTENHVSNFIIVPKNEDYPNPQDLRNTIFNDDGSPDVDEITIKYGMVNIKIKKAPTEDGMAIVIYHGSSLVDAPHRPVKYQDEVKASNDKILFYEFKPKEKILNKDKFEEYRNILKYEITGPDNEPLFFIGDVIVSRKLPEGNIGLHIPYYAKYMMVNIDISDAQFIKNGKATFINSDSENLPSITQTFNELSKTYSLSIKNVPRSDLIFTWKNQDKENE